MINYTFSFEHCRGYYSYQGWVVVIKNINYLFLQMSFYLQTGFINLLVNQPVPLVMYHVCVFNCVHSALFGKAFLATGYVN